ncbi:MAG: MFS transporter [Reyranella sp.]|nr:MFS transporter [Reyranella sp.]
MIALYLLILVDSISVSVVIPLLGPLLIDPETQVFLFGSSLPLRSFVSGLLMAAYVFPMLYMAPVLGRLSDQIGRRRVLLGCGIGVLLGNLLAGVAIEVQALALLLCARLVGGATAAAQPTAQAALVDMGTNKARHLSFSLLFSSLGFVVGPVVASTFSSYSLAGPFYFCAILTALAVVLLLLTYREAPAPGQRLNWNTISIFEGVRCFRDAATDGAVRGILGCFMLMQVAWGSFFIFVSVFLMEGPSLDLSLHQVGIFMSVMGVGFCLANGLVQPFLARYFQMRTLAVLGLALNAAAMLACLVLVHPYQEYMMALVAGITVNIAYPSIVTMLSDRVTGERQGWILGMVGSAAALGWGVSSLLSGALGGLGHALPVVLAAALMSMAALAMMSAGSRGADAAENVPEKPR